MISDIPDDSIINKKVDETNICATQKLPNGSDITPLSQIPSWQPTTKLEMRKSVHSLHCLARCSSLLADITGTKAGIKQKWLQMLYN
jgi:hypothetical protein